mgnify:CR=1 FL=1
MGGSLQLFAGVSIAKHLFAYLKVTISSALRTDPDQHQLTGAIVGLGYDPISNEPLLHDHDIELTFDVEFNNDDIATVMINFVYVKYYCI